MAVQTEGVSQLQARVALIGPDGQPAKFRTPGGQLVTSAAAVAAPGQPFVATVENAKADSTYTVVVSAANPGSFGAYRLAAGNAATQAVGPRLGLLNPDFGSNDKADKAWSFGDVLPKSDARWSFVGRASIETPTDVDYSKLHTKKSTLGTAVVLVTALDGGLVPAIEVTDKDGNVQPVELLSKSGGTLAYQLKNVKPDADYFLRVSSANGATGNYLLAADFRADAVALTPLAAGTLQGATNQAFTSFDLARSQAIYFELTGQAGVNAAVRMTVYDADANAVATAAVRGGGTAGVSALLAPGRYTVRYAAAGAGGAALPAYRYSSRFSLSTDPIGPVALNPSDPSLPATPTVYTYDPNAGGYTNVLNETPTSSGPSSGGGTTPIAWVPEAPSTRFYQLTLGDIFMDPWW